MTDKLEHIARHFYASALAADWEQVASALAEDFVVREAPGLPFAGHFRGLEGLKTLGERVFKHYKRFHVEPVTFTSGKHSVAVWLRAHGVGRQTGEPFDTMICEWLEFRDQKITSITPFYWDHQMVNTI